MYNASYSYKEENMLDSTERYWEGTGRNKFKNHISYSCKEENMLDSREKYLERGRDL